MKSQFDIEQHLASNSTFFQQSHFTLDDLDAYAESFAPALRALYRASEGYISEQQLIDTIRQSVESLKAIHTAQNLANAA
jgi:hypothetical protein